MKKILAVARCGVGCLLLCIAAVAPFKGELMAAGALFLIALLVLLPVAHIFFGRDTPFFPSYPGRAHTDIMWTFGFIICLASVGGFFQKENIAATVFLVLGLILVSPLPDIAFTYPELKLPGRSQKKQAVLTAGVAWSLGLVLYFIAMAYFWEKNFTPGWLLSAPAIGLMLLHPVSAFVKRGRSMMAVTGLLPGDEMAPPKFVLLQPHLPGTMHLDYIQLIQQGENATVEFKSTLRVDIRTNKIEKFIQHGTLKTIAAFLNSQGGTLFIGIDDNKNILGLDTDFNSFSKPGKFDEYQKYLDTLLGNKIGNRFQRYWQVEFPEIEGKTICVIIVKSKSAEPVYIVDDEGQEIFYIRRLASTIDLKTSEAIKYIREHW